MNEPGHIQVVWRHLANGPQSPKLINRVPARLHGGNGA